MENVEHQLRCEVFIFIEVISFQASVNYLSTFCSHIFKKYTHTHRMYIRVRVCVCVYVHTYMQRIQMFRFNSHFRGQQLLKENNTFIKFHLS